MNYELIKNDWLDTWINKLSNNWMKYRLIMIMEDVCHESKWNIKSLWTSVFSLSQFVPFRDYMDRTGNHVLSMARLAKDVLAEIPDQFISYMKSRGIKPNPAPPPYTPPGHTHHTQIWEHPAVWTAALFSLELWGNYTGALELQLPCVWTLQDTLRYSGVSICDFYISAMGRTVWSKNVTQGQLFVLFQKYKYINILACDCFLFCGLIDEGTRAWRSP